MRVHSGKSVALLSSEWRLMIRVGDGDWQTLWIDCMSPKCDREISWECRYCMSLSLTILVQWHWQKSMDASGFGVPSSRGKGDALAVLYYSSSSPRRLSKLCYALLWGPLYVSEKRKVCICDSWKDFFFVIKYFNFSSIIVQFSDSCFKKIQSNFYLLIYLFIF